MFLSFFWGPWHRVYRSTIVNYLISFEDCLLRTCIGVSIVHVPLTLPWPCDPMTYSHDSGDKILYKVHFPPKNLSIRLSRGKNKEINYVSIFWCGKHININLQIFLRNFLKEICLNFTRICCIQCCFSIEK